MHLLVRVFLFDHNHITIYVAPKAANSVPSQTPPSRGGTVRRGEDGTTRCRMSAEPVGRELRYERYFIPKTPPTQAAEDIEIFIEKRFFGRRAVVRSVAHPNFHF